MSNLLNVLNEGSSTPPSKSSFNNSISPSTNDHSSAAVQSPHFRGLERMSLDFIAPGSRSASHRASQNLFSSASYIHYGHSADSNHSSSSAHGNHVQAHYFDACDNVSAQHSSWTSTNSTSNYARQGTTGSTSYTESESMDTSNHDSPPTNHQSSASGSSRNGHTNTCREPRHAYGEEERAFIMVCTILRGMAWKEIEKEFRERFPAGQKRRHQGDGMPPTYPEQERTTSGLTCAYYRIREQWGIPKVRGISDEQKPEVKAIVKKTILNMHDFPDLHKHAQ
ncbi:uncharacterized protein LTHEOB_12911 [Lasiodiplodia theobromae]|uniref:uncharacterized protein n=1 Tax=Lasiodiplodia theobromae TaxID=45133 RepID=UPI0015C36E2F|nr:uncharacterized protein LTHEOB_12911 [Lasiodiplodia theobromae]KAF4534647.1 hypothetical protein LTHEOB_12911 [Lasiodiplodia theobromae]